MLLGTFAALALILSAIGIYGVLSYVVSQRSREIGIRVAIGAQRSQVIKLVLRNGLSLSLTGVIIGVALAAWAAQLMRGLLYDIRPGIRPRSSWSHYSCRPWPCSPALSPPGARRGLIRL